MRKVVTFIAVILAGVVWLGIAPSALAAQFVCDVGYTGPNAQNLCVSNQTYQCSITNTNTVDVTDSNNQVVASGQTTTSGNTTGGSSTSGQATNTNGGTFTFTITNTAPTGTDQPPTQTCVAQQTTPPKEVVQPPVQPAAPSKTYGNGAISGGTGAYQAAAPVLPSTDSDNQAQTIGWVAGAAGLLSTAAIASALLYRRFHVTR